MSELEKFLQQAAERLAEKLNDGPQRKSGKAATQRPRQSSVRSAERRPPPLEAEVIDAEIVPPSREQLRREAGPDRLSEIDTRRGLAEHISQADERMAAHVKDVFQHAVATVGQQPVAASRLPADQAQQVLLSGTTKRLLPGAQLMAMLRQRGSLRTAFIASEIFKRKG